MLQEDQLTEEYTKIEIERGQQMRKIQKRKEELQIKEKELQSQFDRMENAKIRLEEKYKESSQDLKLDLAIFEKEKAEYMKVVDSQQSSYQAQVVDLDRRKTEIAERQIDIKRRHQLLIDREIQIKKDTERLDTQAQKLYLERREIQEKAKEVTATTLKVHEESEIICNLKNAMDSQRQEIEQARFLLESERAQMKAEKLRLEEMRTELNARQKAFEGMRYQFTQDLGAQQISQKLQINIENQVPRSRVLEEEEEIQMPTRLIDQKPRFNAKLFMLDLEDRMHSSSGGTEDVGHLNFLAQEQDYLLKQKRMQEMRQSNLVNSLYANNSSSKGTFMNIEGGFNSLYSKTGMREYPTSLGGGDLLTKSMLEKQTPSDSKQQSAKILEQEAHRFKESPIDSME